MKLKIIGLNNLKKKMNQIIKGLREGPWEIYNTDGELAYKGYYTNNQKIGYWFFNWFGKPKTEFYL